MRSRERIRTFDERADGGGARRLPVTKSGPAWTSFLIAGRAPRFDVQTCQSQDFAQSIEPISFSKEAVSQVALGAGVYDWHDASMAISATICRRINRFFLAMSKGSRAARLKPQSAQRVLD